MTLVLQNNRLLLNGVDLAGSESCCCEEDRTPIRASACNQCCPVSVDELAVKVDFYISQIYQMTFSPAYIMPLGGDASFSGNVLLKRNTSVAPLCVYSGNFCNVDSFISLNVNLVFSVTNGLCIAGGNVRADVRSCLDDASRKLSNSCCQDAFAPGFGDFVGVTVGPRPLTNIATDFWTYSNRVTQRPPMTSPCRFRFLESGDAQLFVASSIATGPGRSGCDCPQLVEPANIAGQAGLLKVSYRLAMESA